MLTNLLGLMQSIFNKILELCMKWFGLDQGSARFFSWGPDPHHTCQPPEPLTCQKSPRKNQRHRWNQVSTGRGPTASRLPENSALLPTGECWGQGGGQMTVRKVSTAAALAISGFFLVHSLFWGEAAWGRMGTARETHVVRGLPTPGLDLHRTVGSIPFQTYFPGFFCVQFQIESV